MDLRLLLLMQNSEGDLMTAYRNTWQMVKKGHPSQSFTYRIDMLYAYLERQDQRVDKNKLACIQSGKDSLDACIEKATIDKLNLVPPFCQSRHR